MNFDQLVQQHLTEAAKKDISRRDFLGGGKKKTEPKQVSSPEVPKTQEPKQPKPTKRGMSRRQFIKKTGAGAALGASINPTDALLHAWPDVMSGVVSKIASKAIPIIKPLENFLSYFDDFSGFSTIAFKKDFSDFINMLKSENITIDKIPYMDHWSLNPGNLRLAYNINTGDYEYQTVGEEGGTPIKTVNDVKNLLSCILDNSKGQEPLFDYEKLSQIAGTPITNSAKAHEFIGEVIMPAWSDLRTFALTKLDERGLLTPEFKDKIVNEYEIDPDLGWNYDEANEYYDEINGAETNKEEAERYEEDEEDDEDDEEEDEENNEEEDDTEYSRFDTAGGSEDTGYAKHFESHILAKFSING